MLIAIPVWQCHECYLDLSGDKLPPDMGDSNTVSVAPTLLTVLFTAFVR